jgi:hypothetical protein
MRIFLSCLILINFILVTPVKSAKLIFKSSFEDSSYLLDPDRKNSKIWWQNINNDKNSNFNWPIKLKGEEGSFQIVINDDNINEYIENKIEITRGIDNKKTKALHQIVKKKEHGWTQVPYIINTKDKEQRKLYIRYSLKLPKNLSEHLGANSWLVLSEYKTISDYRLALYIYTDKNKKLYWYAHGDNIVLDDVPYEEYWYREDKEFPVPEGEWMDVEIFWKRSTKNDGRVWMTINGHTVIDYKGSTKINDPIRVIMLFTNYANKPMDQWIDNIEIWNNYPCGIRKSCHDNKYKNIRN